MSCEFGSIFYTEDGLLSIWCSMFGSECPDESQKVCGVFEEKYPENWKERYNNDKRKMHHLEDARKQDFEWNEYIEEEYGQHHNSQKSQ